VTIKTKLDQLKLDAKHYKRTHNVTHNIALEQKARDYGFSNYHQAQKALKDVPCDRS